MSEAEQEPPAEQPAIIVTENGPYLVRGVPLSRRRPVVSERGEPLAWQSPEPVATHGMYALCRCGKSADKPFCDGSHARTGFDGTETAPTTDYAERATAMPATGVVVRDDRGLCVHAGFCASKVTNVWAMVGDDATADPVVRAQAMAMVEHCPSGALTYRVTEDDADVEVPLAPAVSLVPDGPLFVQGGVAVTRADGERLEVRNRVTLCRCGASATKPLCDGSHTRVGFRG